MYKERSVAIAATIIQNVAGKMPPHFSNAKGKLNTPPPTIVATRLKVAGRSVEWRLFDPNGGTKISATSSLRVAGGESFSSSSSSAAPNSCTMTAGASTVRVSVLNQAPKTHGLCRDHSPQVAYPEYSASTGTALQYTYLPYTIRAEIRMVIRITCVQN